MDQMYKYQEELDDLVSQREAFFRQHNHLSPTTVCDLWTQQVAQLSTRVTNQVNTVLTQSIPPASSSPSVSPNEISPSVSYPFSQIPWQSGSARRPHNLAMLGRRLERHRSNSGPQSSAPMARTPSHRSANSVGAIPIPLGRNNSNTYPASPSRSNGSYHSRNTYSNSPTSYGVMNSPRLRTIEDAREYTPEAYVSTIGIPLQAASEPVIPDFALTTPPSQPPLKKRRQQDQQDARKLSASLAGSHMGYTQRDRSDSTPLTPSLTATSSVMSRQDGSIGSSMFGGLEMLRVTSNMSSLSGQYMSEQLPTDQSHSNISEGTVLDFDAGQVSHNSLIGIGGGVSTDPPAVNNPDTTLSFNGDLTMATEMNRSASNESNTSVASNRSEARRQEVLENQKTTLLPKEEPPSASRDETNYESEKQKRPLRGAKLRTSLRKSRKQQWCDICDPLHQNAEKFQFRGDHEFKRHNRNKHDKKRTLYQTRDGTEEAKRDGQLVPIKPLENCKRCHNERKFYKVDYNCVAHLKRQHFNPVTKPKGQKGSETPEYPVPSMKIMFQYWIIKIEVNEDEFDNAQPEQITSDIEADADADDHADVDADADADAEVDHDGFDGEGNEAISDGFVNVTNTFHQQMTLPPNFTEHSPNTLGHASPTHGLDASMHSNTTVKGSVLGGSPPYLLNSNAPTDNFTAAAVPRLDPTSSGFTQFFRSDAEDLFQMNDAFESLDGSDSFYSTFDAQQQF